MDLLCRVRNKVMYVLLWRTVSAFTRVLFWCLLPSLLPMWPVLFLKFDSYKTVFQQFGVIFVTLFDTKYTTNLPQNGSIIWMENVFHKISVICATHYILVLHVEYDTPCKQFNNVLINMSMAHDYIMIVLYRNTFFCHFCTRRKLLPWISQLPLWWCLINLMPPGRPYSCADKVDGC